jgi:hypothetical protein
MPYKKTFNSEIADIARVYDAMLGGKNNFEADRATYRQIVEAFPQTEILARQQRDFLLRLTDYSATVLKIRQFLELGSGLPRAKNVHDVAQRVDPTARVVYVDHDPVSGNHGRAILEGPRTRMASTDLRNPRKVLTHPRVAGFLDFNQPTAVTMVGVTHFLSEEDDPHRLIAEYRDILAAGSTIGLSAATSTGTHDAAMAKISAAYDKSSSPLNWRDEKSINLFFDGMTVVDPGVVDVSLWRPQKSKEAPPDGVRILGGLGVVKP